MNILFLCTGNSCRSQMAEAWARQLHPDFGVWSAGVVKHGMNPNVATVMNEVGVDISAQSSKTVDDLPDVKFDYIVTLCGHASENCPFFPAQSKRVHRGFDDPPSIVKEQGLEGEEMLDVYRRVRDEIKGMVSGIPDNLSE
ncbi:MAG: arsenate reductase [Desulfovibrio sp.]|nr:arsenate reductase [Desulfovibrio sp.]|tara:strand:+ start:77 stop:499 length:423 start_codon:yes stop_codon:yes gene_type:complete